jgi:hypothetical protein
MGDFFDETGKGTWIGYLARGVLGKAAHMHLIDDYIFWGEVGFSLS